MRPSTKARVNQSESAVSHQSGMNQESDHNSITIPVKPATKPQKHTNWKKRKPSEKQSLNSDHCPMRPVPKGLGNIAPQSYVDDRNMS